MEKETLLTGIRAVIGEPDANGYYGDTGISDRTLNDYVEQALQPDKLEEKDIDDTFYARHCAILKSMGGQMRSQVAEQVKNVKQTNNDSQRRDGNGELAEIRKQLEELKSENANWRKEVKEREEAEAKARRQTELRKQVEEGMKAKGANDPYVLKNTLKGVVFDPDKKVDELVESYLGEYDKEFAESRSSGALPRNTSGGGGGGGNSLDAFFARKADEGRFPKTENKK